MKIWRQLAFTAVCSVVVDSLFIAALIVGFFDWSWFCYTVLGVLSSFTIISLQKRRLVALLKLSSFSHIAINFLGLFLRVPWAGLHSVIVAFPGHAHFLVGPNMALLVVLFSYGCLWVVSHFLNLFHHICSALRE